MEHWDHRTCRAWGELGFSSTCLMSACVVGVSVVLVLALDLGLF